MGQRFDSKKYIGTCWVKNKNFYFRKAGEKKIIQLSIHDIYKMRSGFDLKTMNGNKGTYVLVYKK